MGSIPRVLQGIVKVWAAAFSESVFDNFLTLMQVDVLTTGRRAVCRVLRVAGLRTEAHLSSFHRLLSHRRWSLWPLARALAQFVVESHVPGGVIRLVGNETVTEHPGRNVFGKAQHRDAKRSTRSYVAHLWGHKWVVLAILVELPGTNRPWAVPILVALRYAALPSADRADFAVIWRGKRTVTFSDAITIVRRDVWRHWIFTHPADRTAVEKFSPARKRQLIHTIPLAL